MFCLGGSKQPRSTERALPTKDNPPMNRPTTPAVGATLVDRKLPTDNKQLQDLFVGIANQVINGTKSELFGEFPVKALEALLRVLEESSDEQTLGNLIKQMGSWMLELGENAEKVAQENGLLEVEDVNGAKKAADGAFVVETDVDPPSISNLGFSDAVDTEQMHLDALTNPSKAKERSLTEKTRMRNRQASVSAVLSTEFVPDVPPIPKNKTIEETKPVQAPSPESLKEDKPKDAHGQADSDFKEGTMFSLASGLQSGPGWNTVLRLKSGFLEFRSKVEANCPALFQNLANCQTPKVMVISCCDSRVSPNMILQAQPGDVFTVRNVANLVPPYERSGDYHGTSAALEYAVNHLKVEHLVVLGHSHCGGIKALMSANMESGTPESKDFGGVDFIGKWMRLAVPARERTKQFCNHMHPEEQLRFAERESINVSLANLLTFPFVKEAVNKGALNLHGWYYDISGLHLSTWNMKLLISEMETI